MAIMDTNSDSNQYQYIQDNSLASLDSKTSPLAMLVRTCSQIGADPPVAAAAKSKKQSTGATAPNSATPAAAADGPHSTSPASATYLGHAATTKNHHHHRNHNNNYVEEPPRPAAKLNFKPYENTVLTPSVAPPAAHQNHHTYHHHHNNNNNEDEARPKSSGSEDNGNGKKRKSASPRDEYHPTHRHKSSRRSSSSASSTESSAVDPSTNPIIRSGLEVMQGSKAFCPPPPMTAHSPFKPAADALAAFRHTYLPGAPPWIPAAVSLAAAASKPSPTGADCKDPLCGSPSSGCGQQLHAAATSAALAFVSQYHPMMSVGGCPAGCTQCDHQRYLTSLMASVPAFYAAPPTTLQSARPYICNWVIPSGGGHSQSSAAAAAAAAEAAAVPTLCGKSFGTSDELLQHIRTHTSGSAAMAAAAAAAAAPMSPNSAAAFSAYNGHLSRHLFHHHHPSAVAAYGKPSPPLSMMSPSPYSAFNPTAAYCYPPPTSVAAAAAAAAAAYHHHHSLYSPRGDASTATVSR